MKEENSELRKALEKLYDEITNDETSSPLSNRWRILEVAEEYSVPVREADDIFFEISGKRIAQKYSNNANSINGGNGCVKPTDGVNL